MKRALFAILTVITALALAACGLNGQEPGSATSGITSGSPLEETVGMQECLTCHMDESNPSSLMNVVGDSAGTNGWINGPHANANNNPKLTSTCSYACHDQLGEGQDITAIEAALGIDLGGVNRPVVSCESCHGSGANHFGTGTVQYPNPGAEQCGQCHNADFPHESHPGGGSIVEKYTASRHALSVEDGNHAPASSFISKCYRCHSDEGINGMDAPISNTLEYGDVQCKTCHDPHNPLEYQVRADVSNSAQFNTCTACHELTEAANHGPSSTHSWEDYQGNTRNPLDPALVNGAFDSEGMISDTHVDNPATAWIEGYNINPADARACSSCHDVHEATIQELDAFGNYVSANSINEQWARSAHGGFIFEIKEDAFATAYANAMGTNATIYDNTMVIINGSILDGPSISNSAGDVTEEEAPAWTHYNFSAANRQSCQRCHTSTGFMNFAINTVSATTYNPANNVFYTTAEQREMLYCWACHDSIGDGIRGDYYDKGQYKNNLLSFEDTVQHIAPAGRIANVPDMAASNACMACHSGRGSGEALRVQVAISNVTGKWSGAPPALSTSHYTAAGGVMFRTIGFENAPSGKDYDNAPGFAHAYFALNTEGAWGDNGSCVGCHMRHDEGHTFEAAVVNASHVIEDIPAYGNTCYVCHGPDEAAFLAFMNEQKLGFTNALELLKDEIEARTNVRVNLDLSPYYFTPGGSSYTNWGYMELMAVFNYDLLHHEPAAYVHNSRYARRLIYDSLDILDGGGNDGSYTVNQGAAPEAYDWLGSGTRP